MINEHLQLWLFVLVALCCSTIEKQQAAFYTDHFLNRLRNYVFASRARFCAFRLDKLNFFGVCVKDVLFIPRFIIGSKSTENIGELISNRIRSEMFQRPKAIAVILNSLTVLP